MNDNRLVSVAVGCFVVAGCSAVAVVVLVCVVANALGKAEAREVCDSWDAPDKVASL